MTVGSGLQSIEWPATALTSFQNFSPLPTFARNTTDLIFPQTRWILNPGQYRALDTIYQSFVCLNLLQASFLPNLISACASLGAISHLSSQLDWIICMDTKRGVSDLVGYIALHARSFTCFSERDFYCC